MSSQRWSGWGARLGPLVWALCGCLPVLDSPAVPRCSAEDPRCPSGTECAQTFCVPVGQRRDAARDTARPDAMRQSDSQPRDLAAAEAPRCGNDKAEGTEPCDGSDLRGKTCKDLCYAGGTLTCKDCAYSIAECVVPTGWVPIEAKGKTFWMGSPESDVGRDKGETQHAVTLTHNFVISPTEVSQEQFVAKVGYNPSYIHQAGHPVEEVVWSQAAAYCNKLSADEGLEACYLFSHTDTAGGSGECATSGNPTLCKQARAAVLKPNPKYETTSTIYECPGYRLPTEAEWEFAYRAGTTTSTYAGDLTVPGGVDPVAERISWYYFNTSKGASHHPLARKQANGFCLFDMAGNVWEHCHDYFQADLGVAAVTDPTGPTGGSFRVARGGSHYELPRDIRAARRVERWVLGSNVNTGFRCVRTVP